MITVGQRQAVLRDVVHHNDAWALSQTVQEMLRVEVAIASYLLNDQQSTRSDIRLRLDIAISRLESSKEGTLRTFIENLDRQQQPFSTLESALADLDRSLETISDQELYQSFVRLSSSIGPMTGLSSQAIQRSWILVEDNLQELERLQTTFGLVVVILISCWCGLLLLLLRQNKLLKYAQEESILLNSNLNAAGEELREKNFRLEHAAHHDALTGLPNRTLFWKKLEAAGQSALTQKSSMSLILIDLDEFKAVNDKMGHDVGDALLYQVGERIRFFGNNLHTFCRLGGDEFACLALDKTAEESRIYAQELVETLSAPYRIFDRTIQIGCCIGIVTSTPQSEFNAHLLLKQADIALYRAKESTKDSICLFECYMQTEFDELKMLEDDLRIAVADNAIDVAYQVQVDAKSGQVCGAEALARWEHPTQGPVPPLVFIPLAEQIGLINDLGRSVLMKACTEASSWPQFAKVAVNLSSIQLRAPNFPDLVHEILESTGLDPRRLELEITESVLLEGRDDVFQVIQRLRQTGITVALDDFGTGYSSLAVLRDMPFDTIKLDRSFAKDIASDQRARDFLILVSDLAALLKKEVIIEGIETVEQYDIVRQLSCNTVQGFLFGHPVLSSQLNSHCWAQA